MKRLLLPVVTTAVAAIATSMGCVAPAEGGDSVPERDAVEASGVAHLSADTEVLHRLLAVPAPEPEDEEKALERLQDANDHLRADRHREALDALDEALLLIPALDDWGPVFRAEVLAARGDTAGVEEQLALLVEGPELMARWGWDFRMTAAEEAGDLDRVLLVAEAWVESTDGSATEARIWARTGNLLEEEGDEEEARELFLRALATAPPSPGGFRAARALDEMGGLRSDEEREVGRALLHHGEWEKGLARLSSHLDGDALSFAEKSELRLALGDALYRMRRYGDAEALLRPLTRADGPTETLKRALYLKGRSQLGRGNDEAARASLGRLADLHPEAPETRSGLLLLAERDVGADRTERARGHFERLFIAGVDSPAAELAAVRFASMDYLQGAYETAARTFDEYSRSSMRTAGRQQGAYWAALTLERQDRSEEAEERLRTTYDAEPLSFYGVLAGERLGKPILPSDLPAGPPETSDPALENAYRNALVRIEAHRFVPTAGSLAYESERLQSYFESLGDEALYGYAEHLIGHGQPMRGILIGRHIQRREEGLNLRLLRIVYPFPHKEAVVRDARARGLDPFFVAGLIRQESMFETRIRSGAGAVGLMQIMPATGGDLARELGISGFTTDWLQDPEVNVRMGTHFLASLIRRFDGNVVDALAGYNAGPTRARNWRGLPTYRDPDVFVEHIPFRETRNYVKVVQQNARIYAGLYGCGDFAPCTGMSYATYVRERAGGAAGTVGPGSE